MRLSHGIFSWFLFLLLFQLVPSSALAGTYRKAIKGIVSENTKDDSLPPSTMFEILLETREIVEDPGDFIELMRTPFSFNKPTYKFKKEFRKKYEKFFDDNVDSLFIENGAKPADVDELEGVLIYWSTVFMLRAKLLQMNPPANFSAMKTILQGRSASLKKASDHSSFVEVVVLPNIKIIGPLLLSANQDQWDDFMHIMTNASADQRGEFFTYLLLNADGMDQVWMALQNYQKQVDDKRMDGLINVIFAKNKRLIKKNWRPKLDDYLILISTFTKYSSTDLEIKKAACESIRFSTMHEYVLLRDAGLDNANNQLAEDHKIAFAKFCPINKRTIRHTVQKITRITDEENGRILEALPKITFWLGKECSICRETRYTFRSTACGCTATNICNKCVQHIVHHQEDPVCPLCKEPIVKDAD